MVRKLLMVLSLVVVAGCGSEAQPAAAPSSSPSTAAPATTAPAATTAPSTMAADSTVAADDMDDGMSDEMHDDEMSDEMHDDEMSDDAAAVDVDVVADRTITVVMTEFAFEPDSIEVARGETIEFVLVNEGLVEHELRFTTPHAAEEHIASGHEGHDEDESVGHDHDDIALTVAAGETDTLVVTFDEASAFEIIACLVPGHYEAGMHGDLTLTG